jgi:hypothetical protein
MDEKEFLIWLAGFVDGEGSIGISRRDIGKKYPNYKVFFCITNTNKEILEKIKEFAGNIGYIQQHIKKKNPLLESNKSRFGKKETYDFSLSKKQAKEFLKLIYPYLQVKKRQAELVINFPEQRHFGLKGHWGGRAVDWETKKIQEKMYWECRKLKAQMK